MTQNIQKPNFIAGRSSCDQQDQAIRLVKILGFTKLESESFEDFWSRIAIKESVDHAVLMDESSLDDSSKIYFHQVVVADIQNILCLILGKCSRIVKFTAKDINPVELLRAM